MYHSRLDRHYIGRMLVGAGLIGHAVFLPISIAGTQIALGVAAVGLLLFPPRPFRTPLDWPVFAFVLIAICSDFLSPYGMPGLAAATLWRAVLGFFIVAHGLRLANDPRGAAIRLLYCCSASVAIVVWSLSCNTGPALTHCTHWACARKPHGSKRQGCRDALERWASSRRD